MREIENNIPRHKVWKVSVKCVKVTKTIGQGDNNWIFFCHMCVFLISANQTRRSSEQHSSWYVWRCCLRSCICTDCSWRLQCSHTEQQLCTFFLICETVSQTGSGEFTGGKCLHFLLSPGMESLEIKIPVLVITIISCWIAWHLGLSSS